ncbi:MAG TPA: NADPH-dependent FMN reductase [Candidatus Binatia bacterium]|nr:NADPH-dependent FMN reductase [Candidatus Binatia bacterium]
MSRILLICGSLRAASSNRVLLDAAAALAPPTWQTRYLDVLATLPHFNPDEDGVDVPQPVRTLREAAAWAQGFLISTPEYAHGLPGSLKNALDWLVSGMEVYEKPAVLLNATEHSTHAQASLREILSTMSVRQAGGAWVTVPLNGRKLGVADVLADAALSGALRQAVDALEEGLRS